MSIAKIIILVLCGLVVVGMFWLLNWAFDEDLKRDMARREEARKKASERADQNLRELCDMVHDMHDSVCVGRGCRWEFCSMRKHYEAQNRRIEDLLNRAAAGEGMRSR